MTTSTLSDTELISKCQSGDRNALDILIRRYEVRAYQFAFKLTQNSDEASDLVSEGFIRVYKGIAKFKHESAFTTWLYRILANCFHDFRKKPSSRFTSSLDSLCSGDQSTPGLEFEAPGRSPYEMAESSVRAQKLKSVLRLIPSYQKSIIELYHTDMLSYDQISKILGLPVGTVKSRLFRARLSVREQLAGEYDFFCVV